MIGKTRKIRLSTYDKKWSKLVRERDGECLYSRCHITENLGAHHFIGRANKATRLMLENGVTLCPSHHVFSSHFSAHLTPEKFKRWFKSTFKERYNKVMKRSKVHMTEREAIIEFKESFENKELKRIEW